MDITSSNGEATFTLKPGQRSIIQSLSAGATYTITEELIPSGWPLVQALNTTGITVPIT